MEIRGLENILSAMDKMANFEKLKPAMEKSCQIVVRDAVKKAPKGNGELRRSITFKVERDGDNIQGTVYTPLLYAPYVEFGTGLFAEKGGRLDVPWRYQDDEGKWHSTSGMPPSPYLRPALAENRLKIKRLLMEAHND
jgi:HK97 gp10 family phage protein